MTFSHARVVLLDWDWLVFGVFVCFLLGILKLCGLFFTETVGLGTLFVSHVVFELCRTVPLNGPSKPCAWKKNLFFPKYWNSVTAAPDWTYSFLSSLIPLSKVWTSYPSLLTLVTIWAWILFFLLLKYDITKIQFMLPDVEKCPWNNNMILHSPKKKKNNGSSSALGVKYKL